MIKEPGGRRLSLTLHAFVIQMKGYNFFIWLLQTEIRNGIFWQWRKTLPVLTNIEELNGKVFKKGAT